MLETENSNTYASTDSTICFLIWRAPLLEMWCRFSAIAIIEGLLVLVLILEVNFVDLECVKMCLSLLKLSPGTAAWRRVRRGTQSPSLLRRLPLAAGSGLGPPFLTSGS